MSVNIEFSNLPEFLRAMRRAPAVMTQKIDEKLSRSAKEVAREAKINAPKAFSTLANSLSSKKISSLKYQVSSGVNYAYEVEFGRDGGKFPKVQHILEWMRVKGIDSRRENLSQRDVAYLIARKIYKYGIEPQPFLGPALESKRSRLAELVQEGVDDAIREVMA